MSHRVSKDPVLCSRRRHCCFPGSSTFRLLPCRDKFKAVSNFFKRRSLIILCPRRADIFPAGKFDVGKRNFFDAMPNAPRPRTQPPTPFDPEIFKGHRRARTLKWRDIEFSDNENVGELRRRLRSHITTLRKGKRSEWSRNHCAASESEHNSRLNEIQNEWPQPAPLDLKEDCVRKFRAATSSKSLRQFNLTFM